jgi:acyl-coenzyme A thioesterase PaaI-like protein
MVGAAGLYFEELSEERVVVSIRSRRNVQNHIAGVHAAAMALLAETATGFCVGMNVPDDKLPLIKSMHVDYQRRAQGGLRAVAHLTAEQREQILTLEKGEVRVAVTVTDESGREPIAAEMVWAWVPKKRG